MTATAENQFGRVDEREENTNTDAYHEKLCHMLLSNTKQIRPANGCFPHHRTHYDAPIHLTSYPNYLQEEFLSPEIFQELTKEHTFTGTSGGIYANGK